MCGKALRGGGGGGRGITKFINNYERDNRKKINLKGE